MAKSHILKSQPVLILHDLTQFTWPLKPVMFFFPVVILYLPIEGSFFKIISHSRCMVTKEHLLRRAVVIDLLRRHSGYLFSFA